MNWTESSHSQRDVSRFGVVSGVFLLLVGVWPTVFRGEDPRWWSLVLASYNILFGILKPAWVRPLYSLWMRLAAWLGWFNTRVILTLGFLVLITPVGLLRRWFGKDGLQKGFHPTQASYKVPKTQRGGDHMKKPF